VGRITVADRRLVRTAGGARVESALGSDAEVLEAYRRWFGVALDAVPRPPASSTIPLPHPAAPAGAG
jgi:N-hydroxyarylamine O-acetyltransferase